MHLNIIKYMILSRNDWSVWNYVNFKNSTFKAPIPALQQWAWLKKILHALTIRPLKLKTSCLELVQACGTSAALSDDAHGTGVFHVQASHRAQFPKAHIKPSKPLIPVIPGWCDEYFLDITGSGSLIIIIKRRWNLAYTSKKWRGTYICAIQCANTQTFLHAVLVNSVCNAGKRADCQVSHTPFTVCEHTLYYSGQSCVPVGLNMCLPASLKCLG